MEGTGLLDFLGKLITKKNFLFIVPPALVIFGLDSYDPDFIDFWTANECGLVATLSGLTLNIGHDLTFGKKNREKKILHKLRVFRDYLTSKEKEKKISKKDKKIIEVMHDKLDYVLKMYEKEFITLAEFDVKMNEIAEFYSVQTTEISKE